MHVQGEVRRAFDGVPTEGRCEARRYRSRASLDIAADGFAASCRKLSSGRQMASFMANLKSEMRLFKFL